MKRLLLIIFTILLIVSPVQGEFFKDVILTSPTGIWTDSRAYTTLNAAVTAIGALEQDLYIAKEETVTTLVIPANIRLHFLKNGSIANSNTLTINTKNIYADHRIFTGAGAINFVSGSEVRSVWFEDFETAITQTANDTVTLTVDKADTLLNSAAVGNNVRLKWNASNLITIAVGQTLSNIGDISAPDLRLFVVSGSISFKNPSPLPAIYASWFGDSSTTLNIADAAAAVANKSLIIGSYSIISSPANPLTANIKVLSGQLISISTGQTLTINGSLDAGLYQIFSCAGTGKVIYNGTKYPQWWGAVANGTTDDHAAIQAAIDSGIGPIVLPSGSPNTTNPGTVNSTNYYLGTSALTITKPSEFIMEVGTSIVYDGTDSPLIVDCHAAFIEGLVLRLYDVYTAGNYCLKIVGDGVVDGTTAYIARAHISAHRFANFQIAGMFIKWCRFVENDVDILNMYCKQTTHPNAPGYYFDDTGQVAKGYYQEANHIRSLSVNSRTALYAPGVNFGINQINIGTDYGLSAFSVAIPNMTIGGSNNIITIPFLVINDVGTSAQTPRVIKVKYLSTAVGNHLITPTSFLLGVVDDAEQGSNIYVSPKGKVNQLINPSGESWNSASSPYGWDLNCLAAPSTAEVRHGSKSFAVTSIGGSGNMQQDLPAALVGADIVMSGWFKSAVTNTGAAYFGFTHDATSSLMSIPNDGCWHFLSIPYTVPGGSTNLRAQVYADIGVVDQTVYADGLFVGLGSSPIMLQDEVRETTGSFTCANNKDTVVANTNITSSSVIILEPTNAAAATLMAGATSLYTSAKVAATSFTVTTADASAAAGTETFNYRIIN